MAVALAVLSLLCAIGNDLIYHRRSHGAAHGAGHHLLMVSGVWTAIFAPTALLMGHFNHATILWGAISGCAGIGAHLMLLGAMRSGDLGTCSTIYRLNLIPAALIAIALFGEHLTPLKGLAILVACAAIVLLAKSTGMNSPRVIRLAVGACLLRAGMALGYKQGLLTGAEPFPLLAINGLVWCMGSLMWVHATRVPSVRPVDKTTFCWGLASGMLVSGNVLFLMLALARGQLSTILPITQLSFVATAAIACMLGREAAAPRRITGIACAALSVILLAFT